MLLQKKIIVYFTLFGYTRNYSIRVNIVEYFRLFKYIMKIYIRLLNICMVFVSV